MKFFRVAASAAVAFSMGFGMVQAATLRGADEPAEFPPSSYKGNQYVDSRGCVYIRAGIDGNVTWVPRVTRGRDHICNAKPTFAQATAEKLPVIADAPTAKAEPVAVKPQAVVRQRQVVQAPAAKPAPRTVRKPMTTIASIATPPKMIKPVQPAPKTRAMKMKPAPVPVPAAMATACAGASAISQKYLTGSGVRCGPQAESPVSYATGNSGKRRIAAPAPVVQTYTRKIQVRSATPAASAQVATLSPNARIVPRHVYEQQLNAKLANPIPKGYRQVWDDDRLNPYRAHQTRTGQAQMALVWTDTIPRQLIDRATGQNVTRMNPGLLYPFTDLTTQTQTLAQIERDNAAGGTTGVMSTKSRAPVKSVPAKPAHKPTVQPSGQSFVQVGMFGVPSNAQKTALRLKQSGLPVRIWSAKRNGKAYQIVVAGPFPSNAGAQQALGAVRRSGFSDAFLRR
ncbi:Sporulation related domain protein [Thalassovita gelatinovora]|uniref:Sporulation related domain protein n=1 Tax=Thalassovita gelatinovora TaxID=53501 RepID=A0A0P1FU76_THAGE|nr:SPOR domain-containing protein [Thalassovita gelatinovora]QIZ80178.1 SPOR domain-containing protein [Thalassovita gelatinovora]CUH63991.1 Sporulation related domain protein [Thalassovita gelatinovora]SEQ81206.1 Sporulation related domain-containing protein [Thalassovita gelatinovora]